MTDQLAIDHPLDALMQDAFTFRGQILSQANWDRFQSHLAQHMRATVTAEQEELGLKPGKMPAKMAANNEASTEKIDGLKAKIMGIMEDGHARSLQALSKLLEVFLYDVRTACIGLRQSGQLKQVVGDNRSTISVYQIPNSTVVVSGYAAKVLEKERARTEIITVLGNLELTTAEIEDALPHYRGMSSRLSKMYQDGMLHRQMIARPNGGKMAKWRAKT